MSCHRPATSVRLWCLADAEGELVLEVSVVVLRKQEH